MLRKFQESVKLYYVLSLWSAGALLLCAMAFCQTSSCLALPPFLTYLATRPNRLFVFVINYATTTFTEAS